MGILFLTEEEAIEQTRGFKPGDRVEEYGFGKGTGTIVAPEYPYILWVEFDNSPGFRSLLGHLKFLRKLTENQ